eukprot:775500-Ditylum_brightwellii.AAC.1
MELARLNLRVAKMNLAKGAMIGANINLNDCLTCLNQSGEKWKDYDFTLNLLNELMESEYSIGKFEMAFMHLEDVLENATSLDDKFTAYFYKMKTFAEEENRDYQK